MQCIMALLRTAEAASKILVLSGYRIGGAMAHLAAEGLASSISASDSSDRLQPSTPPCAVFIAFGAPQKCCTGLFGEVSVRSTDVWSCRMSDSCFKTLNNSNNVSCNSTILTLAAST